MLCLFSHSKGITTKIVFQFLLSQNHSDHIKHITQTELKGTLQLEGKIFKVLKPHSTCLYRKLVLFKKNLERHKHILQFTPVSLKALNKISKILQQTCNISLHFSPSVFSHPMWHSLGSSFFFFLSQFLNLSLDLLKYQASALSMLTLSTCFT